MVAKLEPAVVKIISNSLDEGITRWLWIHCTQVMVMS